MFSIGKMLDYSDEVSRRFMIGLLRDVLCVVESSVSFIPEITSFLYSLCPLQEEQIGVFSEIIVDLYEEDYSIGSLTDLSFQSSFTVKPDEENEKSFVQRMKSLSLLNEFLKIQNLLIFKSLQFWLLFLTIL